MTKFLNFNYIFMPSSSTSTRRKAMKDSSLSVPLFLCNVVISLVIIVGTPLSLSYIKKYVFRDRNIQNKYIRSIEDKRSSKKRVAIIILGIFSISI